MLATKNTCVFKSVLLFVLVLCAFVIFYTFTHMSKITIKNDRFSNLSVNDLAEIKSPYPSGTLPTNVLTDYNILVNADFRSKLSGSGDKAADYYKRNENTIVGKLNDMDTNIKTMLTDVNNNIYKQLGNNYARSQEINSIRQDWLQDIDELPYKVLS